MASSSQIFSYEISQLWINKPVLLQHFFKRSATDKELSIKCNVQYDPTGILIDTGPSGYFTSRTPATQPTVESTEGKINNVLS